MLSYEQHRARVASDVPLDNELIVAARDARIVFAKPRARRWLRDFFGLKATPSRLPRALCDWMSEPQGRRGQFVPFAVTEGSAQLIVRIAALEVEKLRCLMLELRPAGSVTEVSSRRGLTSRETEVLSWLARGKTNAQIATILGRKPDTVAKHLQGVFNKLGVDNRTSAIALAWQDTAGRRLGF